MSIRGYVWTVGIVCLVSATAGMLWPFGQPREAGAIPVSITLRVNPGANETLTCLWHGECGVESGAALDWDDLSNGDVFWRSYAYRNDTPYATTIATGTIEYSAPIGFDCYETRVDIVDAFSFDKGHIQYLHAASWVNGYEVDITASSGWTYVSQVVAFTVNQENCAAWDGEHLHQDAVPSIAWAKNTALYNGTPAPPTGYLIGLSGSWQYELSWAWYP